MSKEQNDVKDDHPEAPDNTETRLEPTSCCSSTIFSFLSKIVNSGSKYPYQYKMLFKPDKFAVQDEEVISFIKHIDEKIKKKGKLTFWMIYFYCTKYLKPAIMTTLIVEIFQIFVPILFKELVKWLVNPNSEAKDGYIYLGLILAILFSKEYLDQRSLTNFMRAMIMGYTCVSVSFKFDIFPIFSIFF